jgi:anti-sigma regulatory factor (Ser/Thr protein kinase)
MSTAQQDVVHDVLFAESDDELTGVVGDRLAVALAAGAAVIVIATPEHQRLLHEHIQAAGLDADQARTDGALLVLDARETLDRFTAGGAFDLEAFDRVVGQLVREQAARRPVFAFGEMVALLFDGGRPQEAIELEAAWDVLVQETSVELLCAYPGLLLDDPGHAVHVGSVCSMHSSVVAGSTFHRSWTFTESRTAGSSARRLVANALRARGVPEAVFYDTLSVVTELVANAVTHGGLPVALEVEIEDDLVAVDVADPNPAHPVLPDGASRAAGRGLHLVQQLVRRWGSEAEDGGKVVWAELAW